MTKFCSIINREDSARIGLLNFNGKLESPLLIEENMFDSEVNDLGTLWLNENISLSEIKKKIDKNMELKLIILPRFQDTFSYPLKEFKRSQLKIYNKFLKYGIVNNYPTGILHKPFIKYINQYNSYIDQMEEIKKRKNTSLILKHLPKIFCDVYILDGIGSLINDTYGFINTIINTKNDLLFNSLLFLPNIATPINVSLLVYLGADIFDTTKIAFESLNGIYYTNSDYFKVENLKHLPCSCSICNFHTIEDFNSKNKKKSFNLLFLHNLNILKSEILVIKEKIINNQLRSYVESKCKLDPWISGVLQLYDRSTYYNSQVSLYKKSLFLSTSSESLIKQELQIFRNRILNRYIHSKKDILLILPCSSKKPYSFSKSHIKIHNKIKKYIPYIQEIILTSPIGIVPRELELVYPASNYDTTVTGFWDDNEINTISYILEQYLMKNKYKKIIAHVSGDYKKICSIVEKKLNLDFCYTCFSSPSSDESIDYLNKVLKMDLFNNIEKYNFNKLNNKEEKINIVKNIGFYQLGSIAEALFDNTSNIKGIYPKYQLYSNNKLLATINPHSGLLSLTIEACIRLMNHKDYLGQYTVFINDFIPIGSILSPGVLCADSNIRPGDEVLIKGPNIIGIGKAFMSGYEMCHSSKGQSIQIKHIKKINNI